MKNINLKQHEPDSIHLVAIKPTTYQQAETIKAFIDIPVEPDQGGFSIRDESGDQKAVQMIDSNEAEPVLEQMIDYPAYFKMKRHYCYLEFQNIPSFRRGEQNYRLAFYPLEDN